MGVLALALLSLVFFSSIAVAELEVKETVVSSIAIPELNKPAMFDLSITNSGKSDEFLIYSLGGINIEPNESFAIDSGKTKNIAVKVYPIIPLKLSPDYYSFEYKIVGEDTPAYLDEFAVTMVKLRDAFTLSIEDINPESQTAAVHIVNKYGGNIEGISIELSSLFFSQTSDFSLSAFEDQKIEVALDKEKMKELLAGPYIVQAKIKIRNSEASLSATMNFNEKEGIIASENRNGLLLRELTIEKKNEGNTKSDVSIQISKDYFSALFTSFNLEPDKREMKLFKINYLFTKEIAPNESLLVTAKTNWWILIVILIVAFFIWKLVDKYVRNKAVIKKSVSFVKTRGGEFALKVDLTVKARDFVERIKILDRLPPMVKVFERYGLAMPEKIDERNRRLEWNIQALGKGEQRVLSYIVYSKIGVVGRFELPPAEIIYEYMGKIREASSNRVLYDAKSST